MPVDNAMNNLFEIQASAYDKNGAIKGEIDKAIKTLKDFRVNFPSLKILS
jgi:hypothetical protein